MKTILEDVDAFMTADELTDNHEAKIEVADALGNGERVWIPGQTATQYR